MEQIEQLLALMDRPAFRVEDGRVETMEGEKAANGKKPVLYRLA